MASDWFHIQSSARISRRSRMPANEPWFALRPRILSRRRIELRGLSPDGGPVRERNPPREHPLCVPRWLAEPVRTVWPPESRAKLPEHLRPARRRDPSRPCQSDLQSRYSAVPWLQVPLGVSRLYYCRPPTCTLLFMGMDWPTAPDSLIGVLLEPTYPILRCPP